MFDEVVDSVVEMSDTELRERLRENELERRRLEAEAALLVSVADQRALYSKFDGHRSMAAFLRAEWNCSTSEAATWRSLGRAVDQLDGVGESWMSGRFGRGQAKQFAAARANRRVRDQLGPFVPVLLEHAEHLDAADFATVVDETVKRLDADGAHDARDEAIRHRDARVSPVGEGVAVSASGGDPLTAVEMQMIFERFCDVEYDADVAERRARWGEDAELHELPRTVGQRRHDALVAVFRSAAIAGPGSGTSAALLLNIVCDAATWASVSHDAGLASATDVAGKPVDPFTGLTRPAELIDELVADPELLRDRRCQTDTGVPVHAHDVLRAALSGHVRRVVVDSAGTVIDRGRAQRLFTGSARKAAQLLHQRCQHPGCRLPARFSEVDHAEEWVAHRGGTDQANADIRCGPHNRAKSKHRWRSRRSRSGRSYTVRGDGTVIVPVGVRVPEFAGSGNIDPEIQARFDAGLKRLFDGLPIIDESPLATSPE